MGGLERANSGPVHTREAAPGLESLFLCGASGQLLLRLEATPGVGMLYFATVRLRQRSAATFWRSFWRLSCHLRAAPRTRKGSLQCSVQFFPHFAPPPCAWKDAKLFGLPRAGARLVLHNAGCRPWARSADLDGRVLGTHGRALRTQQLPRECARATAHRTTVPSLLSHIICTYVCGRAPTGVAPAHLPQRSTRRMFPGDER